jgi:hypothetical protein
VREKAQGKVSREETRQNAFPRREERVRVHGMRARPHGERSNEQVWQRLGARVGGGWITWISVMLGIRFIELERESEGSDELLRLMPRASAAGGGARPRRSTRASWTCQKPGSWPRFIEVAEWTLRTPWQKSVCAATVASTCGERGRGERRERPAPIGREERGRAAVCARAAGEGEGRWWCMRSVRESVRCARPFRW